MRALFFGTPDIAVPALEALADIAEVVGVVCQPDRPAGRGLELKAPAVKERARALGLELVQPEKIRTEAFAAWVRERAADVALVIAYGRILPKSLLETPRRGCMNLHASLLPKYRGAAPIQWAIVRGERETGISLMQMDEGCDTGAVYTRHALVIGPDETAGELHDRLAALAAEVVRRDLARAVAGEIAAAPQDHAQATQAPLLRKDDGRIDWAEPARAIHDRVRGMTPWPGGFSFAAGKRLKLLDTRVLDDDALGEGPGLVLGARDDGALIACGRGTLLLCRGQLEGKKALSGAELLRGRALELGMRLGT